MTTVTDGRPSTALELNVDEVLCGLTLRAASSDRVEAPRAGLHRQQDGTHYLRGLLHPEPGDRAWSLVEEARVRAGGGGDGIDVVAMFEGDASSS